MNFRCFVLLLGAIGALCLVAGCQAEMHLYLYNDTDAPITLTDAASKVSLTISPHAASEAGVLAARYFTVTHRKRTFRYVYPLEAISGEYTWRPGQWPVSRRFQFASDHRIYILPANILPSRIRPQQPAGFPLTPQ